MKMKSFYGPGTALLLALLFSPVSAVHGGQAAHGAMSPKGDVGMMKMSDAAYVRTMMMHHAEAIEMSRKAIDKASSTDVKRLAKRIVSAQEKDLKELESLKVALRDDGAGQDQMAMKKMPMEHLDQASGAAFDRMFLQMMIEHHQGAVKMSRGGGLRTAGVRRFARKTVRMQQPEIREMQGLLKKIG